MHFIRAFPIVLIIVLLFGSCFAFADSSWYQGSQPLYVPSTPIIIYQTDNNVMYAYNSDVIPIYTFGYKEESDQSKLRNCIFISTVPGGSVYTYTTSSPTPILRSLDQVINIDGERYYGYFSMPISLENVKIPIIESNSQNNCIKLAFNSQNVNSPSILYNISRFIYASNGWLTSIVGTVMANPLLIFILLIYFVGTALGLLFRFRRN